MARGIGTASPGPATDLRDVLDAGAKDRFVMRYDIGQGDPLTINQRVWEQNPS